MSNQGDKFLESISSIRIMRNAMIVYSYVPIVFMAVLFVVYASFQPIAAERYAQYVMIGLCGLMAVYSIVLLLKKQLLHGIVSKCGLVIVAISFLLGAVAWNLQLSPRYALLSLCLYALGQIAFVSGTWVNIPVKLGHILFYVVMGLSYLLKDISAQSVVAVVAMAIIAYPMVVSYLAINWASKEFFKLKV